MKKILGITLLLSLFALPLFAGKNSQQFVLPSDVRIGDVQLPGGRCNVAWTQSSGEQVQLTITVPGQKAITIPARVVEGNQGPVAVQTYAANGTTYVQEFDTKTARFIVQPASGGTK